MPSIRHHACGHRLLVRLNGSRTGRPSSCRKSKAAYPVPPPDESAPKVPIRKDPSDQKVYQCLYNDRPILDVAGTAADSEEIFSSKDVSTEPHILKRPEPAYPLEARNNGTGGKVILKVLLSSSGKVTFVRAVKELPDGLTESAVKAACQIRFEPATKDGRPVAQYGIVEYGFWVSSRWPGQPRTSLPFPLPRRP